MEEPGFVEHVGAEDGFDLFEWEVIGVGEDDGVVLFVVGVVAVEVVEAEEAHANQYLKSVPASMASMMLVCLASCLSER